jgi:hypothetical protein
MDVVRGRIYGITWPTGHVFRFDVSKRELKDLGMFFELGSNGTGPTFRVICRSIVINPDDGSAYFTNGEGKILRYDLTKDSIDTVLGDDLQKDYFGKYDWTTPGHMAYNWRQVFWYPPTKEIYGVHGNSGYLFKFNPQAERVDLLQRITSQASQRVGMYDQFSFGYLGFALSPNGRTIYYLTGSPIFVDGHRVRGKASTTKGEAKGLENLNLVTYDIPTAKYTDHGSIFFENGERPSYVNSMALGADGTVYAMSRVNRNGKVIVDLFSFRLPGNV